MEACDNQGGRPPRCGAEKKRPDSFSTYLSRVTKEKNKSRPVVAQRGRYPCLPAFLPLGMSELLSPSRSYSCLSLVLPLARQQYSTSRVLLLSLVTKHNYTFLASLTRTLGAWTGIAQHSLMRRRSCVMLMPLARTVAGGTLPQALNTPPSKNGRSCKSAFHVFW